MAEADRSAVDLASVFDDHDIDDFPGEVFGDLEGLVQVMEEVFFVFGDVAVGEDEVGGDSEGGGAQVWGKGMLSRFDEAADSGGLQEAEEFVEEAAHGDFGVTLEEVHSVEGAEDAVEFFFSEVAVGGDRGDGDGGEGFGDGEAGGGFG